MARNKLSGQKIAQTIVSYTNLYGPEGDRNMPLDMLDRLILDPGTRTLGELLQEREWAVSEIRHLRADVDRLSRKHHALRIEGEVNRAVDPALNAQRLLRLSEVSTMIGLGRSSIYRYVS